MRSFVLAALVVWPFRLHAELPPPGPPAPPGFRVDAAPRLLGGTLVPPTPPRAIVPTVAPGLTPGMQCRQAVRNAGRAAGIPDHLMSAIARVESGRPDMRGQVDPWPWSINVEGVDHIYATKAEAIAAVQGVQARGIRSIDVGCMQVNLLYHPTAFPSLDQAFDPVANATYAAGFLRLLYAQTGAWQAATAAYHSATPDVGAAYQKKVQAVFAEEQRRDDATGPPGVVTAMNAAPSGPGAIMLNNRWQAARLLPMVPGAPQRGLDAYRAAPVPVSSRVPVRGVP
jgi:hypothetical protein